MRAAEEFRKGDNERAVDIFVGGVLGDSLAFSKIPQTQRTILLENTLELRGFALNEKTFIEVTCDDLQQLKVPVLLVEGVNTPDIFSSITNELGRCLTNEEQWYNLKSH